MAMFSDHRTARLWMRSALATAILIAFTVSSHRTIADVMFRHAIDDGPLDVTPAPGEKTTEAVAEFKKTGQNPYNGKPEAIADGHRLYDEFCQSCHMPDGSGHMGPSLIGPQHKYQRITTDVGLFEVIFGGAFGAMQPFSKRISQDEILRIMAFVRTLMKQ